MHTLNTLGKHNALTDVVGLRVGHYTDLQAACGVTAVLAPEGAVGAVDVRGSAPGTRETDVLEPGNIVQQVHGVMLSGGSVYGLAAADGAVRWLANQRIGFPLSQNQVAPIVPAAVLYDLGRGAEFIPLISEAWGRKACEAATDGPVPEGCVGAGTGAMAGGIKGGLGSASIVLEDGYTVAAIVAVNAYGSVLDPASGYPWELKAILDADVDRQSLRSVEVPEVSAPQPGQHTTLAVVATDADLTKIQARKIAQMAHDGMARAIRPAHTMFDGDTVFCLATGKQELQPSNGFWGPSQDQTLNRLGHTAADCLARAIINGILQAESRYGITAWVDLKPRR